MLSGNTKNNGKNRNKTELNIHYKNSELCVESELDSGVWFIFSTHPECKMFITVSINFYFLRVKYLFNDKMHVIGKIIYTQVNS